jgi:hypothetical protein
MHADPHRDAASLRNPAIVLGQLSLNFGGPLHRLNNAGELDKYSVAHQLYESAAMSGDDGIDHFRLNGPNG